MVLSVFSLSNVATMTSNVISVNTCQLKIAHGGKDEEFLILYFSQDYGHQSNEEPLTTQRKKTVFGSTVTSQKFTNK